MKVQCPIKPKLLARVSSALLISFASHAACADALGEALADGKASGDVRLRFESVEQDNGLRDAEALTVRTRLGYQTDVSNGLSATLEVEDVRIVGGFDNYSVPPTGFQPGEFSVIADPQVTEVDQAFLQYQSGEFGGKFGAQVIALDGHRHIGHVGWRQDRQTFDALTIAMQASKDLNVKIGYIYGRNGIFAESVDQDAKDIIVNASLALGTGKLVAYAYLLEDDFGNEAQRETLGASYRGQQKYGERSVSYAIEYASQSFEDTTGADFNANYISLELGASVAGITTTIGYEELGSDDGQFGFATPLATLHKFNGWADQFLATPAEGLKDIYATVGRKFGPGKFAVSYHDFQTDESTATKDDHGFEWDVLYAVKFGKRYNAGLKYADYKAQDHNVDAKKLWLWWGFKL